MLSVARSSVDIYRVHAPSHHSDTWVVADPETIRARADRPITAITPSTAAWTRPCACWSATASSSAKVRCWNASTDDATMFQRSRVSARSLIADVSRRAAWPGRTEKAASGRAAQRNAPRPARARSKWCCAPPSVRIWIDSWADLGANPLRAAHEESVRDLRFHFDFSRRLGRHIETVSRAGEAAVKRRRWMPALAAATAIALGNDDAARDRSDGSAMSHRTLIETRSCRSSSPDTKPPRGPELWVLGICCRSIRR